MSKPTVTIAIPAFNEQEVIVGLLNSLVSQKHTNHKLKDICVYSDGSTDNTNSLILKTYKNVKLFAFSKNLGKNKRINQMMAANSSDILVQVDADIKINDKNIINKLVDTFLKNKDTGMVCAYHLAERPNTFFGRLPYFGFKVWDDARMTLRNEGIRYYCEGGMRGFSKDLSTKFKLPLGMHIGEDSYSFYYTASLGFGVKVNKQAKVYISLPNNYRDYVNQMKRFLTDAAMVQEKFDERITKRYETMTVYAKTKSLLKNLLKTPLEGFLYLFLQTFTRIQFYFYKPKATWIPIERKIK